MEPIRYPILKVGIKHYTTFEFVEYQRTAKRKNQLNSNSNLLQGKQQHFGIYSQTNIKKTVTNWMVTQELAYNQLKLKHSKPPYLHTFTTLTLPSQQMHCDKVIKRQALNNFLINMIRRWRVKNYLWKAEAQDNGNIHFHLLTDKYMEHQEVKYMWNNSLNPLGYIDWYTHNNNSLEPNSTDIHALRKIENVSSYICKYVSKELTGRIICGNTWYGSDNVKKLQPINLLISNDLHRWLVSQEVREMEKRNLEDRFTVFMSEKKINYTTLPSQSKRELREIIKHNINQLLTV
jgi:hypothetical protein